MTYLIATHILMWFVENDPKLSNPVRLILENAANTVLVSHVSCHCWRFYYHHPRPQVQILRATG